MKFAEYLQENLVPEWKDRYLDYKAGKKKIKKINNSPKSIGVFSNQQTSTLQNEGGSRTKTVTPSMNLFNDYKWGTYRSNGNESFELPPAAMDPLDEGVAAQQQSQSKVVANDRTPLLDALNKNRTPPYSGSTSGNSVSQRRPNRRNPQSVDLAAIASIYGSSGDNLTNNDNDNDKDDIQLDNFNRTANDEFIRWLDKELQKINEFYHDKESKSVERYLLIQDQLFILKEERDALKRKQVFRGKSGSKSKKEPDSKVQNQNIKTKIVNIPQQLELPSLPKFSIFKKSSSQTRDNETEQGLQEEEEAQNKRDYEVRSQKHIPYYTARRQLKMAVQEFYRELELLRSYRMLNRTGFRKLVKKCDKQITESNLSTTYMEKVNSSYFCVSDVLENLIPKVEDLYSAYFENGNRKVAIEKLRSDLRGDTYYGTLFLSGLFIGIGIPLFCLSVYLALYKTISKEIPEGRFLLQIWAGFFLMLLITMFLFVDCYIWNNYKVNYKFIFEFNPRTALDFRQSAFLPSLSFLLFTLFCWFSFSNFWPYQLNAIYWPWFYLVSMLLIIFCPFKILYYDSRKWLIVTMWRLFLSGFYPVEFKDFLLGDIFCSLSYSMGNISFFFCMYATHWKGAADGTTHCSSGYSRLMGFFSALPPIWRFLQCIRRYFDSGDWFPHLANMVKYGITITYYATLSIYRIDRTMSNKALFIFFACINSILSGIWDILMDWSLMQNKNLLRDQLVYPTWFYYFAMVSDILLRFQWVFYAAFGTQVGQSAFTSFGIGIAEIFRRFIWLLIRMENEHVTNIHLYRASRETPLPYKTISRASNMSRDTSRFTTSTTPTSYNGEDEDTYSQQYHNQADIEAQVTTAPDNLRRRRTLLDPTMFKNLSNAIVNAHAKDFQRKKPQDGSLSSASDGDDAGGSSDEEADDDENSDGENGSIMDG